MDVIIKYFYWDITCKRLSKDDPIRMNELYKQPLQLIFDFLVVEVQENSLKEMASSKNIIPI